MYGRFTIAAFAAAAAAGLGSFGTTANEAQGPGLQAETAKRISEQAQKPAQGDPRRTDMRSLLGSGIGGARSSWRRARPGWTNRHVQRMAQKRRNQARHRKASRR